MTKKSKIRILIIAAPFAFFFFIYSGRVYPGISVAGISVGGKTPEEAIKILGESVKKPDEITLASQGDNPQEFKIKTQSIELKYDLEETAARAYGLGRTGNVFFDLETIINSITSKTNLGLAIKINEEALQNHIFTVAGQVAIEPVFPSVKLVDDEIVVEKGKKGTNIDDVKLRADIGKALSLMESRLTIPQEVVDPSISAEKADSLKKRAENLLKKSLTINFEFQKFDYHQEDLLSTLSPEGYNQELISQIIQEIAKGVNREPQNPVFKFDQGRVEEFAPAKNGVRVKIDESKEKFQESLKKLEEDQDEALAFEIPVEETPPDIKTSDINDLGIRELIGRGASTFRGSISSRIYNINLAATRLNGILVPPGETFSFNNALGDVSKLTGYREAYIIQDGKTVLGDGGGVCQVSTTLFRAVLDAGLPVIERRAHSYRVGYYEQDIGAPGLDATVYSPTTDFKFKNDTPAHILVQAYPNTKNYSLVFEFYGTSDGRISQVSKPVVYDTSPPPSDLYIDDPNLPAGTIKQIDWKAWGAKSKFSYSVTRNGETIIEKVFYSVYRPWQAKFLRGTGPIN
ncbi:MAG: hypothetical protein UW21_C0002G0011 [Candidatus Woesebacteria bacterium GW2011_GWB1_44_11b]|uniref:YoaR-like putative peptidoglycan binding domain-containing protein n=1 Tax=Candidatus Woesebacteria bacterium GW2011_GWB1_44_11b TaxID=1618580 RepID=A0A0G1GIV3_9BACT|nr:MAG: hypothetical protein UW21_C0002G0011 [Candidatus Woesebacteria bacterium GW2011_GWB1_44_11b]